MDNSLNQASYTCVSYLEKVSPIPSPPLTSFAGAICVGMREIEVMY